MSDNDKIIIPVEILDDDEDTAAADTGQDG